SSKERKRAVTGTCRARERDWRLDREGEVVPFSILDSMPVEMPDDFASSAMVSPSFSRKFRTSRPIACSRKRPPAGATLWGSWANMAGMLERDGGAEKEIGSRQ